MMIRLAWALVAGALLAASGCGEVESCERGDVGCIDGPVNAVTNQCKFGLVPNAQGTCVTKSDGGGGPVTDACGGCPGGSLCNDALQCVDVCTLPPTLPVKKVAPPACRPASGEPAYDFATAAVAACTQECIRRSEYCGGGCDPATACTPANAEAVVGGMGLCVDRSPECAMRACETARDRPCQSYQCVGMPNAVPNCAGVACNNSCPGFPEYVNDGVCDDGDLSNAISAVCKWGSDCGDCGPRRGVEPPSDLGLADLCVDPIQCGGDTTDVRLATGWCVRVELALTVLRCVPDCSTSNRCPSGFECSDLVYQENDGSTETLTDDNGKTARACFPNACGNN